MSGALRSVGTSCQSHISKINCLDGSRGLAKGHGDVANALLT